MSATVYITAHSSKDSPEFKKHFEIVQFCMNKGISFPKETSDFFKGKLSEGMSLEDCSRDCIIPYTKDGLTIPIKIHGDIYTSEGARIKISELPSCVDEIFIRQSY